MVEAGQGDPRTDCHLDADIGVRVTSQPCFPEWVAGANAHLQAERRQLLTNAVRPRERIGGEHFGLPRTQLGEVEFQQRSTPSA